MQECCVCFEDTQHRLLPCNHDVCQTCLEKLWKMKKTLCPMCKQVICQNNVYNVDKRNIIIRFENKAFAGITLRDMKDGVIISKIQKYDSCYTSGLRVGQVITHINGLPCDVGHYNICQIFETASKKKLDLEIRLSKNTRFSKFLHFLNFAPQRDLNRFPHE